MSRSRVERLLAVVGASALLIGGFDGLTYAATGGSLILGRLNQANAPTIVQNTGAGAAIDLRVANQTTPPLTTNSGARVANLNAARAGIADNSGRLNGLTAADIGERALPGTSAYRAARSQWWGGRVVNRLCVGSCTAWFRGPQAAVFDGVNVWVVNASGNSLTQILASTGGVVRTVTGSPYDFSSPYDLAFDGSNVWVTNSGDNSVTVVRASDGAFVRRISGPSFGMNVPEGIAFDGRNVWVANHGGNSLTVLSASDGTLVRLVYAAQFGFSGPTDIAFDGSNVWVTNTTGNSITVVSTSAGALVRVVKNLTFTRTNLYQYQTIQSPIGIAFDGTYIWVAESANNTVTKLDAFDGRQLDVLWQPGYGFNRPSQLVADGNHVWVVSRANNTIVRVDADSGDLQRRVRSAPFAFNGPTGIAYDGRNVWVTNGAGNSVTFFPGS